MQNVKNRGTSSVQLLSRDSNFNNHRHQRAARDEVTNTGTYRAKLAGKQTVDHSIEGWLSQKYNICIYDQ